MAMTETTYTCLDCDHVYVGERPEACECGGEFMRIDEGVDEAEQQLLREAAYVVRRAEMEQVVGAEKPWEEREDEPLTMGEFRRFPAGSNERELILCHLILDIWNEIDHLRQHVCPHAHEEEPGEAGPE
jgi:hypothetical protein